ncbi:hypothetical protein RFI_30970 [Reticulomyxa filosa]|uniref:Uncharacterized protein n=1 Tax=Reticulomyxa filosa TaxID=46433 RepID=X6LWY4_RETFI|nr:hypothetical protein RFI_30970 [Reticulomyxa filosa]|eukprot:ETO06423.1 hypothetical protein RFI_30970 [Reticulomyxa filosa]
MFFFFLVIMGFLCICLRRFFDNKNVKKRWVSKQENLLWRVNLLFLQPKEAKQWLSWFFRLVFKDFAVFLWIQQTKLRHPNVCCYKAEKYFQEDISLKNLFICWCSQRDNQKNKDTPMEKFHLKDKYYVELILIAIEMYFSYIDKMNVHTTSESIGKQIVGQFVHDCEKLSKQKVIDYIIKQQGIEQIKSIYYILKDL